MKIHTIFKYTLVASIFSVLTACSEDAMDNVNNDVNHVSNVNAKYILTDVMTSTGFSQIGGDVNSYTSTYVEHEAGTHNQFYRAEMRSGEPAAASTFNNMWISAYATVRDAKIAIEKCSEGGSEEGNNVTLGIAQVMLAYNGAFLTDMFGDTPFTEAGDYILHRIPAVDKQDAIYSDVLELLNSAIANFDKSDAFPIGTQDLIYGSKTVDEQKTLWKKAAYGLKARYMMRLLSRSSNKEADLQTILDCISRSFKSANEQMTLNIYTGSNFNPMFATFSARSGIAASNSLFDKLEERNDPRMNRCYIAYVEQDKKL